MGYRGGVEKVALCARVHHEADNWPLQTDYSNIINMVKRTAFLAGVTTCVPLLAPFVAK